MPEANSHNIEFTNGRDIHYKGIYNMIIQAFLTGVHEEKEYATSDDARILLDWIGVEPDRILNALELTGGKVNQIRFINERIED